MNVMWLAKLRRFGLAALLWAMISSPVWSCPNCKEGLLDNGQTGQNIARGFELSIYLMLSAPLAIVTVLAAVFYWQITAARKSGQQPTMAQVIARAEEQITAPTT